MLAKIIIETLFSLGLFINALLFIPQILKLYQSKNAEGVSFITFAGFNLIQLSMVLHGYLHSDYILVIGGALSLLTCGTVTCLIIFYKVKS